MTKITYIPGEIANAAIDEHGNRKPVTRTQHIFDDAKDKNQAEVNAEVDDTFAFHQSEINALNSQNYVTVDSFSSLPATGAVDTVYRVSNWDGTQQDPSVYSEYAWNGEDYVHLSTKTQIGEVFDISAYHATGGTLATYADLEAALGTNGANVPVDIRRGGMSVKFVQSSDNKYVQYRLIAQNFTTDVTQWQGVDDIPTDGSDNFVKSGGVYSRISVPLDAIKKSVTGGLLGKVSIIGDSISAYSGTIPSGYSGYYPTLDVTNVNQMWWSILLNSCDATLEVNASFAGSGVTPIEGRVDFYERVSILGTPDTIFVALGTNDSGRAVALGDYDYDSPITELSESEFIPAYIKGIKTLLQNYPSAKIILFAFKMGDSYLNAIKNIAKHYSLPMIETRDYLAQGNHPYYEGMIQIAHGYVFDFVSDLNAKVDDIDSYPNKDYIHKCSLDISEIYSSSTDNFLDLERVSKGIYVNPLATSPYIALDYHKNGVLSSMIYVGDIVGGSITISGYQNQGGIGTRFVVFTKEAKYVSPGNAAYISYVNLTNTAMTITVPENSKYCFVTLANPNGNLDYSNMKLSKTGEVATQDFNRVYLGSAYHPEYWGKTLATQQYVNEYINNTYFDFLRKKASLAVLFNTNGTIPLSFSFANKKCTIPASTRIICASGYNYALSSTTEIDLTSERNTGIILWDTEINTFVVKSLAFSDNNNDLNKYLLIAVFSGLGSQSTYPVSVVSPSLYIIEGYTYGFSNWGSLNKADGNNTDGIVLKFDSINKKCTIANGACRLVFQGNTYLVSGGVEIDLDSYLYGGMIVYDYVKKQFSTKSIVASNAKWQDIIIATYTGFFESGKKARVNSLSQYTIDGYIFGLQDTEIQTHDTIISPLYDIIELPQNISWWNDFIFITINGVDELWLFGSAEDNHSTFGTIYRINTSDWSFIGTMSHNIGHCNTCHYDKQNDRLLIGNLPGNPANSPISSGLHGLYIFYNVSNWVSIAQVDFNSVDKTVVNLADLGKTQISSCWGENNWNKRNYVYVIVGHAISKIVLGMGTNALSHGTYTATTSDKFNGTFDILIENAPVKTYYSASNEVTQGADYADRIITSNGHGTIRGFIYDMTDSNVRRKEIRISTFADDGSVLYNTAEGLALKDGYVYQGAIPVTNEEGTSKDGTRPYCLIRYKLSDIV